jgi:hypothetical protein
METFNQEKALALIEEMIGHAKKEVHDNGFYYMLWGWLVFVAAITDYTLLTVFESHQHAMVWAILMPLGGVATAIASMRKSKKVRVKTYINHILRGVSIAYGVSIFIVCLIMPMQPNTWEAFYPVLLIIYAFGIYTYGSIIRFTPLQYGAFANWAISIVSFFFGYDIQLLLLATAVLTGFIIPGHLLNRRFHKHV